MHKNIGTQESHLRSLAGGLIVLFALLGVENSVVSIILAVIAAILAGTAFFRYCPINALLKRDSRESESMDSEPQQPEEETGESEFKAVQLEETEAEEHTEDSPEQENTDKDKN